MWGVMRYDASEASVYGTVYSVNPPAAWRFASFDLNRRCKSSLGYRSFQREFTNNFGFVAILF